ncbi:MAG: SLBB domain-containing protein [Prevotella sp.]|nr:SLBB domain-containing protein [Prevotella sp.]
MKRIVSTTICLLIAAMSAWAQNALSDEQVKDFAVKLYSRGLSRQQIYSELQSQGITNEQLKRTYEKYKDQIEGNTLQESPRTTSVSRIRRANGDVRQQQDEAQLSKASNGERNDSLSLLMSGQQPKRKIFGHDVFNNKNLTFESSMNLATPQNYVLGPGDVVNVDIWGASQESTSQTISPDGTISIDGVGIIQLSGLSVTQAKAKLKRVIGPRYQGSKIELTLGQTRTITVSVMGEVIMPGTYTLSAFSNVFNALYMAGGPNDIGTLRKVKVYRKGKLLANVDVYDFLLNGKLSGDVRLQDNDVITVSPYDALVCISGKVKRPMYYEMKKSESISTLINYAGGFSGDAHTRAVRVFRKAEPQLSVFSVGEFDYNNFHLMDEDSVGVDATLNRYQNMVEVVGAVFRPGMYQVGGDITTVKALIQAAAGLKEDAISTHGVLHRMKADRTREAMSVDLQGILDGSVADEPLRNEDILYIASREERNSLKTVTIHGEVASPGVYFYAENETIEDLILQAGGPTEAAALNKIDVSRRIFDPNAREATDSITQVYSFSLNPDFTLDNQSNFALQPFDEVYVRRSPAYNIQQNVTIEGEVQFEGNYALTNKAQRLSDVVKRAGGLTSQAYIEGTKLLRQMTPEERAVMEVVLRTATRNTGNGKDSIDVKKLMLTTNYPVGIELAKALQNPGTDDDPILREGDRIVVPRQTSTVTINGEVLYPNTIRFKEGKKAKYYIKQSGGYTSSAKKSKAIIIYMNGMVAKANSHNRPMPGCQIVVPSKKQKSPLGIQQWLSLGTTAASLGTMTASIANLLKK